MKPGIIPRLVALAALIMATAGCSSISSRIALEPARFAHLTPADQALVRSGRIAVGFDEVSVWMALGEPAEVTWQVGAAYDFVIWHYGFEDDPPVFSPVFLSSRRVLYWMHLPVAPARRDFRHVFFREGRVAAFAETDLD